MSKSSKGQISAIKGKKCINNPKTKRNKYVTEDEIVI